MLAFTELGLADWVEGLPHGLRHPGRRARRGARVGERQLVALVRAYVADPDLLVLDEATSAVDPATEVRLQRTLDAVTRGRTTVAIAHRLSTAAGRRRGDRVRPGPGRAARPARGAGPRPRLGLRPAVRVLARTDADLTGFDELVGTARQVRPDGTEFRGSGGTPPVSRTRRAVHVPDLSRSSRLHPTARTGYGRAL